MNVQQLIDRLMLVEDKTLPVCIADWNEGYMPPIEFLPMNVANGKYCIENKNGGFEYAEGKYLKLGDC